MSTQNESEDELIPYEQDKEGRRKERKHLS